MNLEQQHRINIEQRIKKMPTDKVIELKVFDILSKKQRTSLLSIQSKIDLRLIEIKTNIFQIGRLLSEAKKALPRGMFQKWIEETWGDQLPYPTAACYKSIYQRFQKNPIAVKLLPLTILTTLKQKAFPDEIFKLVNDNPEAFAKDNPEEFRNVYNDYKNGKIDLDEWERLAEEQIKIGIAIYKGREQLRQTLRSQRTASDGFIQLTKGVEKIRSLYFHLRSFFPPVVGSFKKKAVSEYYSPQMIEAMCDHILADINGAIDELKKLRKDIEERQPFWKHRLIEKDGIIKDELIVNSKL